jgi:hypothetical protein
MDTIRVMALKHKEKISQGPSFIASLAMNGLKTIAIIALKNVPIKEASMPTPKAFVVLPCLLRGKASKHVATLEAVPGIPSNVAEMNPPETPPTQTLMSKAIARFGDIPNVSGRSNVTPMVPDSPGKAPKMMPIMLPPSIRIMLMGLNNEVTTGLNIPIRIVS